MSNIQVQTQGYASSQPLRGRRCFAECLIFAFKLGDPVAHRQKRMLHLLDGKALGDTLLAISVEGFDPDANRTFAFLPDSRAAEAA